MASPAASDAKPSEARPRHPILAAYGAVFKRGIQGLLPALLLIWVPLFFASIVTTTFGTPTNAAIRAYLERTESGRRLAVRWLDLPERLENPAPGTSVRTWRRELEAELDRRYPSWIGIVAGVGGFVALCAAMGALAGSRFPVWADRLALKLPVVRAIYPAARQVVEATFGASRAATPTFSRGSIVAIPFGDSGCRILGFVTGPGPRDVPGAAGNPTPSLFFSHVPTTVTGFLTHTRDDRLIPVRSFRLEDFARYYATAGIVQPGGKQAGSAVAVRSPLPPASHGGPPRDAV